MSIQFYDDRRDIAIPGDKETTIQFCVDHFVDLANRTIKNKGSFSVALSGGSTPAAIFKKLTPNSLDWSKVLLFWSDERAVPPSDKDSNYRMAMDSGFVNLPLSPDHIFRMQAEVHIEENALAYEKLILEKVNGVFDLVMLGMGEDGHTASLFPQTHGLHSGKRMVVANYIPEKKVWRMTLTFSCINAANNIVIYATGKGKASMFEKAMSEPYDPDNVPVQRVGTSEHKALWIVDADVVSDFLIS